VYRERGRLSRRGQAGDRIAAAALVQPVNRVVIDVGTTCLEVAFARLASWDDLVG